MIEIITTIWRQIFQQSSEKTLTRSLWKGLFWILLGVGMPLNAVIDVGYRQDETGEVRLIDSGGSETEVVASGGSFIVDSNYALIVNPNDIEGYPYITYSNTKAYRIMTYLFGTMDSSSYGGIVCAPPNPCSALMGSLFAVFNSGILTLGMVFLSYTIINSTFSDAAQGTSLGQKYSPQEVALRSAVGLSFLIPTNSGYSLIQIAIVRIVLLGSSAGTGLWQYLVDYREAANEAIGSAHLYDGQSLKALGGNESAEEFIEEMANLETCVLYENYYVTKSEDIMVAQFYTDVTGNTYVQTGAPESSTGFDNSCGQMSLGQLDAHEYALALHYQDEVRKIAQPMVLEYFANNEMLDNLDLYQDHYFIIKDMMRLDLELLTLDQKKAEDFEDDGNLNKNIRQSEWLDVPGYFYRFLTTPGHNFSVDFSSSLSVNPNNTYRGTKLYSYYGEATDWSDEVDQSNGTNMGIDFQLKGDASYEVTRNLQQMFDSVSQYQDPLVGLAAYGRQWLDTAMGILIFAFTFGLTISVVAGMFSDQISSSQMGMGMAIVGLISAVLQAFGAIIPVASMFAIGLPMMPLIIYSAAIISWIIYTIAAVLSGPIIAIGLMSPGEGLGKASPALLLIINLFARPCLHVIGLVAGAKLFNVAYLYFTQAFMVTVYQMFELTSLPSDGMLLSLTSIIFLYAYTFAISALCNRCYSLITAIPDRVFMWIGAPPAGLPDSSVQAARTASQRAASSGEKTATDMMKGLDSAIKERSAENMKKIKEREKRGIAAGSLSQHLINTASNAVNTVSRGAQQSFDAARNFNMRNAVNNIRQNMANQVRQGRQFFGASNERLDSLDAGRGLAVARGRTFLSDMTGAVGSVFGYDNRAGRDASSAREETARDKYQQVAEKYAATEAGKVRGLAVERSQTQWAERTAGVTAGMAYLALGAAFVRDRVSNRLGYSDDTQYQQARVTYDKASAQKISAREKVQDVRSRFEQTKTLLNDAYEQYSSGHQLISDAKKSLSDARYRSASPETINKKESELQQAIDQHQKRVGLLIANKDQLSGYEKMRLGVSERLANMGKKTRDVQQFGPDRLEERFKTYDFHRDSKTQGIIRSFVSRNYNRAMGRLTSYGEDKWASLKGLAGYSKPLKYRASDEYFSRAKVAETAFVKHDQTPTNFAQRFMLRRAQEGFNLLGAWKNFSLDSLKSVILGLGKSPAEGASQKMGSHTYDLNHNNPAMRVDYRATYQFKKTRQEKVDPKPDVNAPKALTEKQKEKKEAQEQRLDESATRLQQDFGKGSFGAQGTAPPNQPTELGEDILMMQKKVSDMQAEIDSSESPTNERAAESFYEKVGRVGMMPVRGTAWLAAGAAKAAISPVSYFRGSKDDSSQQGPLSRFMTKQSSMLAEHKDMVVGDMSTSLRTASIRMSSYAKYLSWQVGSSFADNPEYNRAIADQYYRIGFDALAHNKRVQPTLIADRFQVSIRKEVRAARKKVAQDRQNIATQHEAIAEIRHDLVQQGQTIAQIEANPKYSEAQEKLQSCKNDLDISLEALKSHEWELDRHNLAISALRKFDRAIKSTSKSLGQGSRLGIARAMDEYQSSKWAEFSDDTPLKSKVGTRTVEIAKFGAMRSWVAARSVADAVPRLTATLLIKTPGAIFRPGQQKKEVSDRQIFTLEHVASSDDVNSLVKSFKDLAEVIGLSRATSALSKLRSDNPALDIRMSEGDGTGKLTENPLTVTIEQDDRNSFDTLSRSNLSTARMNSSPYQMTRNSIHSVSFSELRYWDEQSNNRGSSDQHEASTIDHHNVDVDRENARNPAISQENKVDRQRRWLNLSDIGEVTVQDLKNSQALGLKIPTKGGFIGPDGTFFVDTPIYGETGTTSSGYGPGTFVEESGRPLHSAQPYGLDADFSPLSIWERDLGQEFTNIATATDPQTNDGPGSSNNDLAPGPYSSAYTETNGSSFVSFNSSDILDPSGITLEEVPTPEKQGDDSHNAVNHSNIDVDFDDPEHRKPGPTLGPDNDE